MNSPDHADPQKGPPSTESRYSAKELADQSVFDQHVASGEIKFHSRGSAPEPELPGASRKPRFGTVFRSNPGLLIILVDILLVILVLTLVFPFIRPGSEVDNFEGYSFSLHGYLNAGAVYTSLMLQPNPSEIAEGGLAKEPFQIEFRILESDTRVQTEFVPFTEGETLDSRILRKKIELPEDMQEASAVRIRAAIKLGEESVTLEKKMRQ
ncbi:MAG: hypothetical protein K9L66_00540 [Spirochaetaceae bacterium]|nr:hypothetical protein [Spirochaetaceae bacterium]MCF7947099.1 hypothetical protein [Spirochaetia bacterium]MCF7950100.1 hypothetical protein [Spirochaetaceae bacterium]